MLGCFERAIFPRVSRSAARLAPELSVSPSAGCCGALHAHNGEREAGEAMALEVGRRLPGTIVTTSGGCAAHLATVLGRDRVRELSEWLLEREPETERASAGGAGSEPGASRARPRIALQDSCHLRNGLGVHEQPRQLIEEVGEYVELEGAERCCGGAGTYWLLEPDQSAIMLEDALDRIEAADIDIVATVNPGCLRQLGKGLKRRGSRTRAVHLAELL
jgi:glycolate oxidase iron-sulfur subunit